MTENFNKVANRNVVSIKNTNLICFGNEDVVQEEKKESHATETDLNEDLDSIFSTLNFASPNVENKENINSINKQEITQGSNFLENKNVNIFFQNKEELRMSMSNQGFEKLDTGSYPKFENLKLNTNNKVVVVPKNISKNQNNFLDDIFN